MEKLRIVFMGTPDFAVATLALLVARKMEIVAVVTAPDRPAGRGRKPQESAVKKYAVEKGLKVLQPTNLKSPAFLEELRTQKGNLQIVVAFRMLPREVWNMPRYGTFNLHASLLPQYRGAAPINWAIMNGEKKTGVTTFFIDDKIDTGEILLQEETDILDTDTAGTLHDRLMYLGADLVLRTVDQIREQTLTPKKQQDSPHLMKAPKLFREDCRVDWHRPLEDIYNHIRGLSPYPTAWTTIAQGTEPLFLKIYLAAMEPQDHDVETGRILTTKREMKVAVKGGFIRLLEVQLSGKRRMKTQEVLNGLKLPESAHMV